jgi:hypothetical protein
MENGGDGDDGPPMETTAAAAAYIASLTEELARIARRHGLRPLGHILDMARLEADQVVRNETGSEH